MAGISLGPRCGEGNRNGLSGCRCSRISEEPSSSGEKFTLRCLRSLLRPRRSSRIVSQNPRPPSEHEELPFLSLRSAQKNEDRTSANRRSSSLRGAMSQKALDILGASKGRFGGGFCCSCGTRGKEIKSTVVGKLENLIECPPSPYSRSAVHTLGEPLLAVSLHHNSRDLVEAYAAKMSFQ